MSTKVWIFSAKKGVSKVYAYWATEGAKKKRMKLKNVFDRFEYGSFSLPLMAIIFLKTNG